MAAENMGETTDFNASLPPITCCLLPPYLHDIEKTTVVFPHFGEINVWNIALQQHYQRNAHHPEYHVNPLEMGDLNKRHMLCDLLGSFLGSQWKRMPTHKWTIPKAANVCKNWKNWKFVQDVYTGSFDESEFHIHPRWYRFCNSIDEKVELKTWFKLFLAEKINAQIFTQGLYYFHSVHQYMDDLQWHKYAVFYVGRKLFPDDEQLMDELVTHDNDKWDAFMIAAYVLKWVFNEEVIEIDEDFLNIDFDSLVYFIKEVARERKISYEAKIKETSKNYEFLKEDNETNESVIDGSTSVENEGNLADAN